MLWATALLVGVNVAILAAVVIRGMRATKRGSDPGERPAASAGVMAGVYSVTGLVRELKADGTNIVIRHERIPGFMEPMTMSFVARDPREIVRLRPDDRITFRLLVTADESWIDSVQRVGEAEASAPAAFSYETARVVRDVEPLEIGQVMPDYGFTNQFGEPFRFGDLRGRAVAVTFVFTRCPLPDFCPRMLKNFAAVAEGMRSRSGGPTNWHLVTITIDPAFDTPAVLRTHAERYQYDPRKWTFVTGALIDIDAITEQVGLVFRRQTPDALPDHNVRTLVVDPAGRLRKQIVGNTWKPEEVIEDLVVAATAAGGEGSGGAGP